MVEYVGHRKDLGKGVSERHQIIGRRLYTLSTVYKYVGYDVNILRTHTHTHTQTAQLWLISLICSCPTGLPKRFWGAEIHDLMNGTGCFWPQMLGNSSNYCACTLQIRASVAQRRSAIIHKQRKAQTDKQFVILLQGDKHNEVMLRIDSDIQSPVLKGGPYTGRLNEW